MLREGALPTRSRRTSSGVFSNVSAGESRITVSGDGLRNLAVPETVAKGLPRRVGPASDSVFPQ